MLVRFKLEEQILKDSKVNLLSKEKRAIQKQPNPQLFLQADSALQLQCIRRGRGTGNVLSYQTKAITALKGNQEEPNSLHFIMSLLLYPQRSLLISQVSFSILWSSLKSLTPVQNASTHKWKHPTSILWKCECTHMLQGSGKPGQLL